MEKLIMVNVDKFVPTKDQDFVPFGDYSKIEQIISSGSFFPVYITGPTGNGKTSMVEQACAAKGKAMIRTNLNAMTDEDQLIGSKTLVDGNIEIQEGPVLVAMRHGLTLLLDEIDAGQPNTLLCLQPVLEGKPYYFKLKNEIIVPADGFNIFATANTKGKGNDDGQYIGTNVQNEAFLDRFAITIEHQYPSSVVEIKIITELMKRHNCFNEDFASILSKWADAIRRTFAAGGVNETITTRRISHIIKAFSIFKKERMSIELCCNRFDEITKKAFLDLYDKLVPVAPVIKHTKSPTYYDTYAETAEVDDYDYFGSPAKAKTVPKPPFAAQPANPKPTIGIGKDSYEELAQRIRDVQEKTKLKLNKQEFIS